MPIETYRRAAVLLMLTAAVAGCGGDEKKRAETPFAYDSTQPLGLEQRKVERRAGGIEVRDVSFAGPQGKRLLAYLVVPAGRGPHPGVLYAHGAAGGRSDLLTEAVRTARIGAIALVLETPHADRRETPLPSGLDGLRAFAERESQAVIEARRAVDLLQSLPEVDDDRVAYVGWSAGARTGAILAGVERRIRAYDLLAGGASPVSEYTAAAPPELRQEIERLLSEVDPLRHIARHGEAEVLFQNGRRDEIVPREALTALSRAAGEPKEVRWYESGHLPSRRAGTESRRWLAQRLGLDGA